MQSDPLAGCRAKLDRSAECIGNLEHEIDLFLNRGPRPYRVEGRFLEREKKYAFYAFGPPSPPLRFAVLTGEVAHHLRASLDHLVWALASQKQQPTNRVQFPVCETTEKFELAIRNGALLGVGRRAVEKIKALQPFNEPTPREAAIYVLHQLDVTDKHRLPLVVTNFIKMGESLKVGSHLGDLVINGLAPPPTFLECSESGTEIFWITFEKTQSDLTVDMDFQVNLAVRVRSSFAVELIFLLKTMQRFVTDTICQFQEEF